MPKRGGARRGAGRKPAPFPRDIGRLLAKALSPGDWYRIVRILAMRAAEGDVRAAQTLLRFRAHSAGEPAPAPEHDAPSSAS